MQKKNLLLLNACALVVSSALYAAQEVDAVQAAGGPEVVNIGCTTPPSPAIQRVKRQKRTQPKPPAEPKHTKQARQSQKKAEQAPQIEQPVAEPVQPKEKPSSYAQAVAPSSETASDADGKVAAEQAQVAPAAPAPEINGEVALDGAENPEGPDADAKKADGRRVWRTWFGASREARVMYSLSTSDLDKRAEEYLASQDGRHEIGRELDRATQELVPAGLTPDTASLVRLTTILNKGHEQKVSINLADLQNAHAKIKKVKGEVTSNLNTKLAQALAQFMAQINHEFAGETKLIALLAATQHQAAQMRRDLNNDPENDSDDEENPKAWNQEEVFEQLTAINTPHNTTTLGVTISLNEQLEEVN